MKKLAAWILSLSLLLGCGSALAAGPAVAVGSADALPGGSAALAVTISGSTGVRNFDLEVVCPAELTLTAVETEGALCDGGMVANVERGLLCWAMAEDVKAASGTLFTLRFSVAADAAPGLYAVALRVREGGAFSGESGVLTPVFTAGSVKVSAANGGSGGGTIVIDDPEQKPLPPEPLRFSDVAADAWYYDCVTALAARGVISGYPDGSFWPNAAVSWGEALKLVLLAAGSELTPAKTGHWAEPYRAYAAEKGWCAIDTGALDAPITRAEAARLIAGANGIAPAEGASPFPDTDDPCAAALHAKGLVVGYPDGSFGPQRTMTRAELSMLLWRLGGAA